MITALFLLGGVIGLYYGAEFLVNGASSLALAAKIKKSVVGLTVVAFGTSLPELVVSIHAGAIGAGNISIGNVVGSNIFNIAIVLGLAIAISPIIVKRNAFLVDTLFMVVSTGVFIYVFSDHAISKVNAIVFIVGLGIYLFYCLKYGKAEVCEDSLKSKWMSLVGIVIGLLLLVVSARLFVKGAIMMANALHISEAIIGLTIVAAGTSLPELATSVVAAIKKENEIAIGNVIGSNVFNILLILGVAGMLTPLTAPNIGTIDIAMMLLLSLAMLPMAMMKWYGRTMGIAMMALYGLYIVEMCR